MEGITRFEDRYRLPVGISVNMTSFAAKLLTQVITLHGTVACISWPLSLQRALMCSAKGAKDAKALVMSSPVADHLIAAIALPRPGGPPAAQPLKDAQWWALARLKPEEPG